MPPNVCGCKVSGKNIELKHEKWSFENAAFKKCAVELHMDSYTFEWQRRCMLNKSANEEGGNGGY